MEGEISFTTVTEDEKYSEQYSIRIIRNEIFQILKILAKRF